MYRILEEAAGRGNYRYTKEENRKILKKSVNYGPAERGNRRCGNCIMFNEPNVCSAVRGMVKKDYVCVLFRDKADTSSHVKSQRELDFEKLAHAQRGEPEELMTKAQWAMGGGVMSVMVEHIGDLTHRLSEYDGRTALDSVGEKVRRAIRYLNSGYGFEREYRENIASNKKDPNVVKAALQAYANAHKKLEVYNDMQNVAREAAVRLGEEDFSGCLRMIRLLEGVLAKGKDYFKAKVQEYDPHYPAKIYEHGRVIRVD